MKEELNVDVIGIEEGFGGANVKKDFFLPGSKGCLLRFIPNEVPVGRMFLAVSRLSEDESTRHGVESVREHLKSGSVTVLIAHHSLLDAVAIGIALGRELESQEAPAAKRIVVPVGAKHWFDPRLRGFWEQLQKMEYVEFYPTVRLKEAKLIKRNKLELRDGYGNVVTFERAKELNQEYARAVEEASQEKESIVFVAAAAERTNEGNKPNEVVSKLIAREDQRTKESMMVMLAAAVPHAILGLFNLRVRLWEEVVDIRRQALEELDREKAGRSYPDEIEVLLWLRVAELIEAGLNQLER